MNTVYVYKSQYGSIPVHFDDATGDFHADVLGVNVRRPKLDDLKAAIDETLRTRAADVRWIPIVLVRFRESDLIDARRMHIAQVGVGWHGKPWGTATFGRMFLVEDLPGSVYPPGIVHDATHAPALVVLPYSEKAWISTTRAVAILSALRRFTRDMICMSADPENESAGQAYLQYIYQTASMALPAEKRSAIAIGGDSILE